MKQNKRGILMFASMILSISLMCGAQIVKASDGDLIDTGGILLNDTDLNSKIDEVHITVDYTAAVADAIAHTTDEATTIGKFTVTDTGTDSLVTITSVEFVSGDNLVAIFKLVLDEANVSEDTSETALDVVYGATDSDLKITSGSVDTSDFISVDVAAIGDIADEEEDEEENGEEDENEETPSDEIVDGPTTPNPNSGVTLYRMRGDHRVYVIKDNRKRWVKTAREFERNGYKWDEVQEIAAELLEEFPEAEALVIELLRAVGSHKVYRIEDGKKRWIETAGEFNAAGYSWGDVQEVSPETLASYRNAISSGLLRVVGGHKVYRLEDGKKRWIKTAGEFNVAGYRWEDIEEVTADTLEDYPDSE